MSSKQKCILPEWTGAGNDSHVKHGYPQIVAMVLILLIGFPKDAGGRSGAAEMGGTPLSEASRTALSDLLLTAEESVFVRLSRQISVSELIGGFYDDSRAMQRISLDVAGYLEDPWPVMPYFVAFLAATRRELAVTAAGSLRMGLKTLRGSAGLQNAPAQGQVSQLLGELYRIAETQALEADLRIFALDAARQLGEMGGLSIAVPSKLFADPFPLIRSAAIGTLTVPLSQVQLDRVARMVSDTDPMVRGGVVTLLCENALSHQVEQMSSDLTEVISDLLKTAPNADGIALLLPCLARFPYAGRARLTDLLLQREDSELIALWKELTEK